MRRYVRILFSGILWLVVLSSAYGAGRATPEDAVAFVKKGVEYVKTHGKEKALAAFNDPNGPFIKGELYFFVYGINGDGIVLAHGQNPKMIGRQLIEMKDLDGVYIIKEALKVANSPEGKGWIRYRWPNSLSGKVEMKRSYIERVNDIWIGCGVYE
ncbi:MAG TPA: cache domain-containing protein [Noviherbaspirillum sp.]|nr:cache domain-containing protein [Noviherbaspirillum sp.]